MHAVHVGQGRIRAAVHVEEEELDAGIGEFGVRARAQVESSCKGAVHGNVFEAQMVVVAAVGGEKDQVQSVRGHAALVGNFKFEDLERDRAAPCA